MIACGGSSPPPERPAPAALEIPTVAEAERKDAGPAVAAAPAAPPSEAPEETNTDGEEGVVGRKNAGDGFDAGGVALTGHPGGSSGTGYGSGVGHGSLAPTIRVGTVSATGRLPKEVVSRIVRQNFGRFRNCYEQGLRTNPLLKGRVLVKFVIDEKGLVRTAADGGSDLPEKAVVACVLRAFANLSFPAPESGTVSVDYPLVFAPADPPVPPKTPTPTPKKPVPAKK